MAVALQLELERNFAQSTKIKLENQRTIARFAQIRGSGLTPTKLPVPQYEARWQGSKDKAVKT